MQKAGRITSRDGFRAELREVTETTSNSWLWVLQLRSVKKDPSEAYQWTNDLLQISGNGDLAAKESHLENFRLPSRTLTRRVFHEEKNWGGEGEREGEREQWAGGMEGEKCAVAFKEWVGSRFAPDFFKFLCSLLSWNYIQHVHQLQTAITYIHVNSLL